MKKAIALTAVSLIYVVCLISMFFIDASSLGGIYREFGVGNDTVLHVLAFFFLAFLLRLTFSEKFYGLDRPILHAMLYASLIAAAIELVQGLMPTRHPTMLDLGLHLFSIALYGAMDMLLEKVMMKNH